MAKSHHHHHPYREPSDQRTDRDKPAGSHANITCDMVRAYVAQVGLVEAKAVAQSAGMTASDERRAMRCLDKKV